MQHFSLTMERLKLGILKRFLSWLDMLWYMDGIVANGDYSLVPFKREAAVTLSGKALLLPLQPTLSVSTVWRMLISLITQDQGIDVAMAAVFQEKSGVFLDVGTHVGSSLVKCKSLDFERKYFGFEPNVNCCKFVEDVIFLNNMESAEIFPVALWNTEGAKPLFSRIPLWDPTASLLENHRPKGYFSDARRVFTEPGDKLVELLECSQVAFIKIDVEGGELEVLDGFRKTILRDQPYIYFEALPAETEAAIQSANYFLSSEQITERSERLKRLEVFFEDIDYEFAEATIDGRLILRSKIEPDSVAGLSNYLAGPRGCGVLANVWRSEAESG